MLTNEHLTSAHLPEGLTTVGVELEGYWHFDDERTYRPIYDRNNHANVEEWMDVKPTTKAMRPPDYKYDGSVHRLHRYSNGEVCTPGKGFRKWGPLRQWILEHYPTRVDAFCGLHIHLGVSKDQLTYAFDNQFWKELTQSLPEAVTQSTTKRWLANRLAEGRSSAAAGRYSVPNTVVTDLRRWENSGRYRAINYMESFYAHKTMEIRVLPMAATTKGPERAALEAVHMVWSALKITADFFTNKKWQRTITDSATVPQGGLNFNSPTTKDEVFHTQVVMAEPEDHRPSQNDHHRDALGRSLEGATVGCNCAGCMDLLNPDVENS